MRGTTNFFSRQEQEEPEKKEAALSFAPNSLLRICAVLLLAVGMAICLLVAASAGNEAQAKKDASAAAPKGEPKGKKTNNGVSAINSVAAWGANDYGQLGDGTTTPRHAPVPVSGLDESDLKALAAGEDHSLAVKRDGTVWAWGANGAGQLGNGTDANSNTPVQVKDQDDPTGFLTGVQAIDAGGFTSIALKNDGTVVAWGDNEVGQLGNGTDDNNSEVKPHPYPVHVKDLDGEDDLTGVEAIAAGLGHNLALLEDGTVVAWGGNEGGQLGVGSISSFSNTPLEVIRLRGAEAIAAGLAHSLALLEDGTVKAWGSNFTGELGYGTAGQDQYSTIPDTVKNADGTPLGGVKQLAGGGILTPSDSDDDVWSFSLALKVDGTVVAWGANRWGQLGDGTTTERHAPVKVANLSGIKAISAGYDHSLARTTSGKVWAWGANGWGQLGDGTTTERHAPFQSRAVSGVVSVAAGWLFSLAG